MRKKSTYTTIDEYIDVSPKDHQPKLTELRKAIKQAAPDAEEKISYQMPTYYLKGNLVHFALCANHIGFYPTSSGINKFKRELARYKSSKGAVQFPLAEPLPLDLIKRIVQYRVEENTQKSR